MEEPDEHFPTVGDLDDQVIQERHFQPVSEKEELEEEEEEEEEMIKARKEEEREEALRDLEDTVRDEIPPEIANGVLAGIEGVRGEPVPNGALLNGCYSSVGPENASVSISKPAAAIVNRTARPFFSPAAVQSPELISPVMEVPPVTNYSNPPLPTFTAPRPVAFSPPPPPPSYPTPPLPAFTNQPPQGYSSPPPMSPIMSPASPPPLSQFPSAVSHMSHHSPPNPPAPHYGPPTAPRPSVFVPRPAGEKKPAMPIKTGILEEGAARRSNRKAMFTFKEKTVVSPNPELLSMVQGADERKKHGHKSVPEPVSEEELLALGAEASNFLAEEEKTVQATSPEWASCLKTSRTRARVEHKPDQSLTNASGKGAELFAKRQSRMEQFEIHKAAQNQMRSPSPTMSLPPSWVYPSNMPGRVKAIAKNSDVCAQLSQNLKAQQSVQRKPVKKAPPPPPVPESPPLENGCTKVEMDLSRHQPYQLNSSLFILNPIKEPVNSLPRGAPPPKPLVSSSYSRQTSLANSPGQFSPFAGYRPAQCMSPQPPLSPIGRTDSPTSYGAASAMGLHRITSPVSAFSPERVASPRSGVQAPRPTFSAKRAGIEPQVWRPSFYYY